MKFPPRASPGANAIACSTPSRPSPSEVAKAARSSGLFTSSSSTSGGDGSRFAARSVIRRVRPNPVRTTSAPSCWARSATENAIEPFVRTPVMSKRLPSRSMRTSGQDGLAAPDHFDRHAQDGAPVLVHDLPAALDEAVVVVQLARPNDLALHAHAVADPDGQLEDRVADLPQRDDPIGVEVHQAGAVPRPRNRPRRARRNSTAARRWPSSDGWNPSAA